MEHSMDGLLSEGQINRGGEGNSDDNISILPLSSDEDDPKFDAEWNRSSQ
jgi:hypothetical protein